MNNMNQEQEELLEPDITNQNSENPVDEVLMQFSEMIDILSDYEKQRVDPETGQVMTIEEIKLNYPIELKVTTDSEEKVTIKSSPPTQRTETTILPVFHQIKMRIVRDDGE